MSDPRAAPIARSLLLYASPRYLLEQYLWKTAQARPDRWQVELCDAFAGAPDDKGRGPQLCVVSARQSGKSTSTACCAVWSVWVRGGTAVIIAQNLRQAVLLIDRCREVVGCVPELGKPTSNAATKLALGGTGGRIVALSSTPTAVRGWTANACLIVDEGAYVADNVIAAVSPTRASCPAAPMVVLSSAGRRAGWFYEIAEGGDPTWRRWKVTWRHVARIRTQAEADRARMSKAQWLMEYDCQFGMDAASVFDEAVISRAKASTGLQTKLDMDALNARVKERSRGGSGV